MFTKVSKFAGDAIFVAVFGTKAELKDRSKAAYLAIRRGVKVGADPSPRSIGKPKLVRPDFKGQVPVYEQSFQFGKAKPDKPGLTWLCKMDDGVSPEVLGGPYKGLEVPRRQLVRLMKVHRQGDADVYFQATLQGDSLELHPFSGGFIDNVSAEAGV